MLHIAVGLAFLVTFLLVLLVYEVKTGQRARTKALLDSIKNAQVGLNEEEPLSLPFRVRVLRPLEEKITNFFAGFLPLNLQNSVAKKLEQCGNPRGLTANVFMGAVGLFATVLPVVAFVACAVMGLGYSRAILISLATGIVSILFPALWLQASVARRLGQIELELPDVIDLLVVSVEAGLSFDSSLAKVSERMKGPLAQECTRTLQEMKMGKPRHLALRDLSNRVGSRNLSSFLAMVIQATQMGVTMGRILRIQSESMRRARRQRAQEAAMKAPIKMVFPLVFCIFPALLIVLLGPAIIQFLRVF
jgi:tight adherence protein C